MDSTFLANHDFSRLMTMLKDSEPKVRLAASMLLTLPGRPFLYYGDELGLKCDKKLTWLSMPCDEEGREPGQTAWMCTDKQFTEGTRPVTVQSRDKESLYSHFKRLIHLRNKSPALSHGDITATTIDSPQIVSFFRTKGDESLLVIHNLSGDGTTVALSGKAAECEKLIYSSNGMSKGKAPQVLVAAYSTVILSR
ncbi:MAG: alpha-amylase family glycosyl hydrolase [Planctomycetota bacterium]